MYCYVVCRGPDILNFYSEATQTVKTEHFLYVLLIGNYRMKVFHECFVCAVDLVKRAVIL